MRIPVIRGVIDRRILANYRVDPEVLAGLLPPPFRPQLVGQFGVAGICLIRLKQIRPRGLPAMLGIGSENAAHRIAVEWTEGAELQTGVYIPRRDTSSRLNALAGGRLFPGEHHLARFNVSETSDAMSVSLVSRDGVVRVVVEGNVADELPHESIFSSLDEASRFFEAGSLGYSPASQGKENRLDGLELRTNAWRVRPLAVTRVASSFFDDQTLFPAGSVAFDHALLMRDIPHEWHGRGVLCRTQDCYPSGVQQIISPAECARLQPRG